MKNREYRKNIYVDNICRKERKKENKKEREERKA